MLWKCTSCVMSLEVNTQKEKRRENGFKFSEDAEGISCGTLQLTFCV